MLYSGSKQLQRRGGSKPVWLAGSEAAQTVGQERLEGKGSANAEWQNDVEGLQAVYESSVEIVEPCSVLYSVPQHQVHWAHSPSDSVQACQDISANEH